MLYMSLDPTDLPLDQPTQVFNPWLSGQVSSRCSILPNMTKQRRCLDTISEYCILSFQLRQPLVGLKMRLAGLAP